MTLEHSEMVKHWRMTCEECCIVDVIWNTLPYGYCSKWLTVIKQPVQVFLFLEPILHLPLRKLTLPLYINTAVQSASFTEKAGNSSGQYSNFRSRLDFSRSIQLPRFQDSIMFMTLKFGTPHVYLILFTIPAKCWVKLFAPLTVVSPFQYSCLGALKGIRLRKRNPENFFRMYCAIGRDFTSLTDQVANSCNYIRYLDHFPDSNRKTRQLSAELLVSPFSDYRIEGKPLNPD